MQCQVYAQKRMNENAALQSRRSDRQPMRLSKASKRPAGTVRTEGMVDTVCEGRRAAADSLKPERGVRIGPSLKFAKESDGIFMHS